MLGLTTFFILVLFTIGPIPAGIIYQLFEGLPLLVVSFFLNIVILIILATKSIEPRLNIEELEAG
jgi:hypothetical protein